MKLPRSSGKPKKPRFFFVRRVSGNSMLPGLRPGRVIIASPYYRRLNAGDVVIIRHGGLEKVKRIREVNKDRLFVVGDNQSYSTDSRTFGWLSTSVIIAKVIWPIALHEPGR